MNISTQLDIVMMAFKRCGNEPEKIIMSPSAYSALENWTYPFAEFSKPLYAKTIPTFNGVEIEIDETLKDCKFYIK